MLKYEAFVKKLSNWSGYVAVIMLLLIPLITALDIFGSKIFNLPVRGSVELTGLLFAMLLPLAAAVTLIHGQHIKVDVFTNGLSKKTRQLIDSLISLLLFIFCGILCWQSVVFGMANIRSHEVSNTLNLPLYPFMFVMAFAFIPLALAFFLEFLHIFTYKDGQK